MIPEAPQQADWQQQMRDAYRRPADLLAALSIPLDQANVADSDFPMRVPKAYAQRMKAGDINDPLLRQVLPVAEELDSPAEFSADPLQELGQLNSPGLLQKYKNRALLITTAACGIHCRYCFRREFPYSDATASRGNWQQALDKIAADPTLEEIILSGGDPLALSDTKLAELIQQLEAIPHLQRLRFHSRQPVVLPDRITQDFLQLCQNTRLDVVMVIHCNHAQEIDEAVAQACLGLNTVCSAVLNQGVLLAGINDSAVAQIDLSKKLFKIGVLPYYLYLLDKVRGSAHFEITEDQAQDIMAQVHAQLSGYLVPRLVREVPGNPGKTPVAWTHTNN